MAILRTETSTAVIDTSVHDTNTSADSTSTATATTTSTKTATTRTASPVRRRASRPSAALIETMEARERLAARIEQDRSQNKTSLIYMVLLGGAACLALAGVVSTAQAEDSLSVDAPPPIVFEQPATPGG